MTVYLILEKTKDDSWALGSKNVEAASAKAAVRAALNGVDGSEGVFVAIPARSWQPVVAQKETRLTLK